MVFASVFLFYLINRLYKTNNYVSYNIKKYRKNT